MNSEPSALSLLTLQELKDIDQGGKTWELVRRCIADSYYFFQKSIWSQRPAHMVPCICRKRGLRLCGNLITKKMHLPVCLFLEDFLDGKITRALYSDPRRTLKTTFATTGAPPYFIVKKIMKGEDPFQRFGLFSNTKTNAERMWGETKSGIEANETLHFFVPEMVFDYDFPPEVWNKQEGSVPRFYRTKDPTFDTIGTSGGKATGRHYDFIFMSDLINEENQDSPDAVDKAIEYVTQAENLLEDFNGGILVEGNFWGIGDLNTHIVRERSEFSVFNRSMYGLKTDGPFQSRKLPDSVIELCNTHNYGDPIWPERFDREEIGKLMLSLRPRVFCTPGDAPVLMADMTSKAISDVQVGEKILSFDENAPSPKMHRRMKISTVTAKHTMRAEVVEATLASGRKVRSTADHPWFTYGKRRSKFGPLKIGENLVYWCDPSPIVLTTEQQREADWLGGIFDGEGHAREYNIYIAQNPYVNPEVCARIEYALNLLEIPWGCQMLKGGPALRADKTPRPIRTYFLRGGRDSLRRFLLACRPAKSARILKNLIAQTADGKVRDEIIDIKPVGETDVFSLETTEKTYSVYGYLSHNSAQVLNEPSDPESADFKSSWLKTAHLKTDTSGVHFLYYDDDEEPMPLAGVNLYLTWDPALDGKNAKSRNAMLVTTIDHRGRICVLKDYAKKEDPLISITAFIRLCEQYKGYLKKSGVEEVLFQKVLRKLVEERALDAKVFTNVKALKVPRGLTKDQRIRAWIGTLFEEGKVYVLPRCTDFIQEYNYFGVSGTTVDLMDCFAHATQLWQLPLTPEQIEAFEAQWQYTEQDRGITGYGSVLG